MSKKRLPTLGIPSLLDPEEEARLLENSKRHSNPNPMVRESGLGPAGKTCATCHRLLTRRYYPYTYYKCGLRENTNGAGTDIRLKWDACAKYEEKTHVKKS